MKQLIMDYINDIHALCNGLDVDEMNKLCEALLESYKAKKRFLLPATAEAQEHPTIFVAISAKMRLRVIRTARKSFRFRQILRCLLL